jgi:streptogramin lyase
MKESKVKKGIACVVALALLLAGALFASSTLLSVSAAPDQEESAPAITVSDIAVPGGSSFPWGTAFDSSGNVWVALPGCDPSPTCSSSTPPGKLVVYNPVSKSWIKTVSLPSGYGQPLFLAFDSGGRAWFPMPMSNSLGMYNPATNTVQQWSVPTPSSGPWGVAVDSKGIVWFTEHYANKIGSFNPETETFQEITTPAPNSQPYGIIVDASDNVWFTENVDSVALIAQYTTQGELKEYKIRNSPTAGTGLTPHLLTIDQSGNIWWSEGWVHAIGRLNVAQAQPGTNKGVQEFQYVPSCPNCGAHTSGISADQSGRIWLDDSLQNTIGIFPASGNGLFSFTRVPGNHPHDGLNVDKQGRAWFDEEFSHKLGLAIVQEGGTPTPTPTSTTGVTQIPGTILGQDTFQRANQNQWGTASDGQVWGGDANSLSVFSIVNNSGQITNGGIYNAILGPTAGDAEVLFTSSINAFNNANLGAVLRWGDTNNWYKGYIDGTNLIIQKKINGSNTTLNLVPFAAVGGTSYSLRFRILGNTLSLKAWASNTPEPGSWTATATDSSLTAGHTGLRVQLQNGTTAIVTSFQSTVPGGTPTPTVPPTTPTVTPTLTPSVTPSITPGPGGTLGQDTFQRADQSLWGVASGGESWSGDANQSSTFSIVNNAGIVANTNGISYSAVLGAPATNAEVVATGSISSFADNNLGPVLRWQDGNNWYKAFIDGNNLFIQKKVNGATSIIASTPFVAAPNTAYTIHFRAVGSTLTASAWPADSAEPGSWMVTATDSSFSSGYCGLRLLASNATIRMSSFVARTV